MLKMSTWGWIGTGLGIGGMLVGMYVAMSVGGSQGMGMTTLFIVIFGGMFLLFWKLLIGPMVNNSRLQKNGIPGRARILEVKDTGVTINNNPQVKLVLEVKTSLGQTYQTTCRTLVSRINPFAYQPGMEVPVKIDPKNEKNVVLDYSDKPASASSVSGSASAFQETPPAALAAGYSANHMDVLKAELEQLQKEHDSLMTSGKSAKAIIKKYTWLGVYVNGQNPYVSLELEVLPETSPAFAATTKGVVAEASVEKYQPGHEVYVKYDLYDNTKVTVDHS